ncbi:MAG TPA: fibronectin type III domain-containing protein [Anaeromyxobacter sp.]
MRRALLLVLLAAPALASAQDVPAPADGRIAVANEPHTPTDEFINAAECAGGSIKIRWDVENAVTGSTAAPTSFTVYAHNSTTLHSATSTGPCPANSGEAGDTALKVGSIGTFDPADTNPQGATGPSNEVSFDTSTIVSTAGLACNATGQQTIVICVQGKAGGTAVGTARGALTLWTDAPAKPTGVSAGSGNNALNVSWTKPAGSPSAEYYVVEAIPVATTSAVMDPDPIHSSAAVTGTDYRLTGLVNTVVYSVRVYAFSTADNRSVGSDATQGMPELANNLWDGYKNAGGREQGGCAAGAAGPIALLLAAAGLAVLRRRK